MIPTASARRWKFRVTAYLLTMACCNIWMLVKAEPKLREGYQDFVIYYGAGKDLREGRAEKLYDIADEYRTQLTFAANVPIRHFALPYNHPPFEAVLFAPFARLGFWPAYLVWTALNASMLAAMAICLRRYPTIKSIPPLLMAAAMLSYFPLINGLLQGQDVILLTFLAVMALMCLERNAEIMAGACLGACLFRPHLAVPLVLLLAVRRWRVMLGFIPVAVAVFGVSAAVSGWGWPAVYLRFVMSVEKMRVGNFGAHVVPNLRGILGTALRHFPKPVAGAAIAVASIAVFAAAARRIRYGQDSLVYIFCLASATTILVCFHALSYDLLLLLPIVFFLLGSALVERGGGFGLDRAFFLFVFFLTPFYIYLNSVAGQFFWFGFLVLWMYVRLLATRAPVVEPA